MKKLLGIYKPPHQHWVGDGFPVRSLFTYGTHARQLSPFLLLDLAGPTYFEPTTHRRGVGEHPHRGFETVTIVYDGEVEHRDSTGQGGVIGPGDVQWMTAAGGILHEEFHSQAFSERGGKLHIIQLWVNLLAKDKMAPARYQPITADDIPTVALPDAAGSLRVIAGEFDGHQGPAHTHTPMAVWDFMLNSGSSTELNLPEGWNTALVVLRGVVHVNGSTPLKEGQMVVLSPRGSEVQVQADEDSLVLLLSGEPIDEPVVGYGPFVMNTRDEINQALIDFQSGRFGTIA